MANESEQEKRETLANIVAEMREKAAHFEKNSELMVSENAIALFILQYADRIDAAWRRDEERAVEHATRHAEAVARDNCRDCIHNPNGKNYEGVGNAAAMRDALDGMCKASQEVFCSFARETFYGERRLVSLGVAFDKAKAALSAPPRQCDVGTAEEQGERCMAQFDQWRRKGDGKKLITAIMAWAQTPYEAEEGGAE